MTIAGGATSAYLFSLSRGALQSTSTTFPRDRCQSPAEAVARLMCGQSAIVAGGDVFQFRKLWAQEQAAAGVDV